MFGILKKPTADTSAADIAKARAAIDLPALERALDEAKTRRADRLVAGAPDGELLRLEAAIDTARLAVERAEIAAAELDRRHAAAVEAEKEAAAIKAYRDAVAKRDAVARRIRDEYPGLAAQIAALAKAEAEADAAVDAANETTVDDEAGRPTIQTTAVTIWGGTYSIDPTLRDTVSLLPLGDFEGFGAAGGRLTREDAYVIYGIGGPGHADAGANKRTHV
ncbi:hypothetical protein [Amorphus orientalis]|uniref:Type II secretory pathway component HofQ n=1 Tax=Amorphus orientalis TaxID=649198 RepID=A0AAE3VS47_9HYPH|nr:hypothetical protein [Amorphus orientalis]MDQ0317357.1 type II secretory pathway component HofQ [Amorphus orientalis]